MARTTFSGPVKSENGFISGDAGATVKAINSGSVSLVISALAAAAEEDLTLTITGVAAGDIVQIMPANASMETGVSIGAVWVSAANTVKVRVSNLSGSSLTGSTANATYLWHDLT